MGDTFQLFYRGIIEAPNPYVYSIVSVCEKGENFPRYFEYTPQEEGKHLLTVSVYDANRNLLGSANTTLNVIIPNQIFLGLNLTNEAVKAEWVNEIYNYSWYAVDSEGHVQYKTMTLTYEKALTATTIYG